LDPKYRRWGSKNVFNKIETSKTAYQGAFYSFMDIIPGDYAYYNDSLIPNETPVKHLWLNCFMPHPPEACLVIWFAQMIYPSSTR